MKVEVLVNEYCPALEKLGKKAGVVRIPFDSSRENLANMPCEGEQAYIQGWPEVVLSGDRMVGTDYVLVRCDGCEIQEKGFKRRVTQPRRR